MRDRVLVVCALVVMATVAASVAVAAPAYAANASPVIVPSVQEWTGGSGNWTATSSSRVVVSSADSAALAQVTDRLRADFTGENGYGLPVAVGAAPSSGDIVLALGSTDQALGDQGYRLTASAAVTISARTTAGVFNGTRSLLQGMRATASRTTFPQGTIRDWPRYRDRGQMIDVGRRFFSVQYLKDQIRQMAWYKLNTLHLHLSDWNGYRLESKVYPTLASPDHYTQAQITDLVAFAHTYDVTIVPEVDLPSHSSFFSTWDSSLAFTCASMSKPSGVVWEGADTGGWTLDVTKPATRTFAKNLVTEIASLFDSPYVHIGGDEIPSAAAEGQCPELVNYQHARGFTYPNDVMVDFANELNATLQSKGKTAQLWTWWDNGYQTSIAPQKNVVITDWTSDGSAHANAGYPVVVTTDGIFYVSVGFGQKPGDYGYSDPRTVFDYPYSTNTNVQGYRLSRWMDKSYKLPVDNVDHFARRPLQVMADRTWGGPKAASFRSLIDAIDRVGEGQPGAPVALSQSTWSTVSASSQETQQENGAASNAFDNDQYTVWHTQYTGGVAPLPAELVVDTGSTNSVAGFRYLPRQDGGVNGKIKDYEVQLASSSAGPWTTVASGSFADTPVEQRVSFSPTNARYAKLRALSEWGPQNTFAAVAEFDLLTPPSRSPSAQPVAAGATYRISSVLNGKVIDDPDRSQAPGTQLVQWGDEGGANQGWTFALTAEGNFSIKNTASNLCMSIDPGLTGDGAKVTQTTCDTTAPNQRWKLQPSGTGYQLVAVSSGRCVDIPDRSRDDGTKLVQWACHGGTNQQWNFS